MSKPGFLDFSEIDEDGGLPSEFSIHPPKGMSMEEALRLLETPSAKGRDKRQSKPGGRGDSRGINRRG